MIKKLTNRTDLDKCCAQIELVERLITQPETFDIRKVLAELKTKKDLLMKHRSSDYATILKYFYPEKKIKVPEVKEDISLQEVKDGREMIKQANNALAEKEKELKTQALEKDEMEEIAINKALEIRKLKAKLKILQEVKLEEVKEEIPGE
ncbi:MAG: hypothetical protein [Lokiarchaeia virus VerdaV1]|uniref:Uncharacterized protein n=1 Tax=Lokiarchaeia virus VerdaV1 TaxID=3070170 RepID=A0AA35CNJ6_9CAUD|nr:MAG: hypothetical protein QIT41_gp08 [Lokiarchaeia virus VerdaV1]BDI54857.1 MAG: hypothetical protein [Lokiarchaeia virus VerdaV1]